VEQFTPLGKGRQDSSLEGQDDIEGRQQAQGK
jgi:hypothetical protein